MAVLLTVAAMVLSVRRVYLVSDTPEYPGFMNTYNVVNEALPKLDTSLYNVTVLRPECVGCENIRNMSEEASLNRLLESVWGSATVAEQLESALAADSGTYTEGKVVVAIATSLPTSLSSHYASVSFLELQCTTSSAGSKVKNPNHIVLQLEAGTGAYMNGVIAALASYTGGKKMGVLYDASADRSAETAFWQGVSDGNSQVCLSSKPVTMSTTNRSWDAAQYTLIKDQAAVMLQEGVDIILSNLDVYDVAVLDAISTRSEANYVVFGVTGATTGGSMNHTTLNNVLISRVEVNWFQVLNYVLSQSNPLSIKSVPVRSQSSWTVSDNVLPPGAKVADEMNTNCSARANATYADTVRNVYANVTKKSLSFPSDRPTANCARLRTYLVQTKDEAQGCLTQDAKVRLVGVGMYVNNLGNVDMKAGSFYVDFNLYLHQSRTAYATIEQVDSMLQPSAICRDSPCACPDFGQNEWENYIPSNATDTFSSIVNLVNIDRVNTVTSVLKTDTVGTTDVLVDYFRVQGTQYFQPELRDWPMDTQSLKIILEDLRESTTDTVTLKFCHLENFAGLSTNARYFPGMDLQVGGGSPWTVWLGSTCWPYLKYPEDYVAGHCHAGVNDKPVRYDKAALPDGDASCTCLGGTKASSRYAMEIVFKRPALPSFMKTFLPAIFITLVNQGVWFLYPKVAETRLGVCGSSLISGVMYHVSVTSNTPETSVLTWADRFMVVVYFNNLVAFTAVFYQTILYQAGMNRLAWRSFRMTRMWGPLVAVSSFAGVFFNESASEIVIWVIISTILAAFFVYFIGDMLLHLMSQKWLAFLRTRDSDARRAPGHLIESSEPNYSSIPLAHCETVN
eukprot:TRINITY_DN11347_c0_g1_i1.p1 TRINITY_DN11347_c0_g1~~TRINITY_DN11347_c0_g1_i1.p1  ORF type:complete len:860 (+),score=266.22 TRINITY_DN11347_c0_g1_i1:34-2580(+)